MVQMEADIIYYLSAIFSGLQTYFSLEAFSPQRLH